MTFSTIIERSPHRVRLLYLALALVTIITVNLTACGHEKDRQLENQSPSVLITGGIVAIPPEKMERDSVNYSVEILWTGWDADGIIDHYQYTVDVPDDLLDKINDPLDTGIAWVDTTAFRASFLFRTDEQDSLLGTPIERFRGNHTFYVRAVDNEGGVSAADYIAFTATNITPKTTITVPSAAGTSDVLIVGRQFNIVWEGLDPDNPDPKREPAYYEWKLKQMPNTWQPTGRDAQYSVDVDAADVPWIRISRDTTSLRLSLQTGFPYILAIRAVDEAGGIETKFVKGMNMLVLDAYANSGTPILTVRERSQGTFQFPGPIIEFEMAAGACVRFEMSGNAAEYGGLVQGYNWGVDVDPDNDGPGSGFRGWSLNRFTDDICFEQEGIHTVVLKCRDTGGGVTTGIVLLRVIRFAFDREMLYVDDFRRPISQGFRDANHDARNLEMLRAAGIPVDDPNQFDQFDTFGPEDQQGDPTILRLSDIGPYKIIYWDVLGSGFARNPGLVAANACNSGRILQAYSSGGGALWVTGESVFAGFKLAPGTTCLANTAYEFGVGGDGLAFVQGNYLCDYMKICGGGFFNARTSAEINGLLRAEPTPEGTSVGLRTLAIDRTVVVNNPTIAFTDAMFTPTFDDTRGLDSLYIHRAPRTTSGMDRKPNAFRYRDPGVMPSQGPIAVFGFPLFKLQQGSVADSTGTFSTAKIMLDWLKREQVRYFALRGGAPASRELPSSWAPGGKGTR
ncbi:MAG: hypothetical protein SGI90_06005 [Candidatus Eisenbacteria bacterium]|nr:hypothetical protein [Candidatus Eisenbacteria bacterium]